MRQSFDYHSMIVSQPDLPQELQDFPALSADQVISEIENMMADDTHTSALDGEVKLNYSFLNPCHCIWLCICF